MTAAPRSAPFVDGARLTDEEYFALPETKQRCDLIDGVLYVSPSPEFFHQRVALKLAIALEGFAERTGGQAFIAPMDVRLAPGLTRQPDVGYVSPARLPIIGRKRITGAPDLVVEVSSPSNARMDRGPKLALYARYGVSEIWLADPHERTVTVHAVKNGRIVRSRTVAFGEAIPSAVVDIGDGGLGELEPPPARD